MKFAFGLLLATRQSRIVPEGTDRGYIKTDIKGDAMTTPLGRRTNNGAIP